MTQITITKGVYAKKEVINLTCIMLSDPKQGKNGMFVTIDPAALGFTDRDSARVAIDGYDNVLIKGVPMQPPADAMVYGKPGRGESHGVTNLNEAVVQLRPNETKKQALERIRKRFKTLDTMAHAVAEGVVRGLIVSGPPGVGKSYGVEEVVDVYNTMHKLEMDAIPEDERANSEHLFNKVCILKGAVSPIHLYITLYNHRSAGDMIIFDDCDSIFNDDLSLNLLKAALDSGKKRELTWATQSAELKSSGIPTDFEFKAGVIFITNIDFERNTSRKLKPHMDALVSRCHYLDLDMHSVQDCFYRIEQIMGDGMLSKFEFGKKGEKEIVDFMHENVDRLNEISLRTVLKLAELKAHTKESQHTKDDEWKDIASMTLMKKGMQG